MNAELKLIIPGNDISTLDPNFVRDFHGASAVVYQYCMNVVESTAAIYNVPCLKEGTYIFALQSGATFIIYASLYKIMTGSTQATVFPIGHTQTISSPRLSIRIPILS